MIEEYGLEEILAGIRRAHGLDAKAVVQLGPVTSTPQAATIPVDRALACLARHQSGEWGLVPTEDAEINDRALGRRGTRVMSAWAIDPNEPSRGYGANTLWIITQWAYDHSQVSTTLLLPDEY